MDCKLHFNLARKESYRVAKFRNYQELKRYVDAECADSKCKRVFTQYAACKTLSERKQVAERLDAVRYAFYKKYTNNPSHIPTLPGAA